MDRQTRGRERENKRKRYKQIKTDNFSQTEKDREL